jgi:hypothetical protein
MILDMKKSNMTIAYIASVMGLFFYIMTSCGVASAFQVTDAEVNRLKNRGYSASTEELKEGYGYYVKRCGNCHHLKDPTQYTVSQWQLTHLPAEFQKAKVDAEKEKKLITYFVVSKAK